MIKSSRRVIRAAMRLFVLLSSSSLVLVATALDLSSRTTLYGGAFDSASTIAYAEV